MRVPNPQLWVIIAGTSVIIPAAVEFVDIAGLVKGAAQGEEDHADKQRGCGNCGG